MTRTGFVPLLDFKPQQTDGTPRVTGDGVRQQVGRLKPTTLILLRQPLIFSVLHSAKPQLVFFFFFF